MPLPMIIHLTSVFFLYIYRLSCFRKDHCHVLIWGDFSIRSGFYSQAKAIENMLAKVKGE